MRYALAAIYVMVGIGMTMGIEKANGRDMNGIERALTIFFWPIGLSALTTHNLTKVSKE